MAVHNPPRGIVTVPTVCLECGCRLYTAPDWSTNAEIIFCIQCQLIYAHIAYDFIKANGGLRAKIIGMRAMGVNMRHAETYYYSKRLGQYG